MDKYKTVLHPQIAELKDRGSKFIAYLCPVENENECHDWLNQIKNDHGKANHHCFAFRLFDEKLARLSDDGEPSGSAGRPIMGAIEKHYLYNTLIVVVRYFGGTKLGVRGLINAYGGAAEASIQKADIETRMIYKELEVVLDYPALGFLERFIQQNKLKVLSAEFTENVRQILGVSPSKYDQIRGKLEEEIKEEFGSQIQTPYPVKIKPS